MKIEAGGKLKTRKPAAAPASSASSVISAPAFSRDTPVQKPASSMIATISGDARAQAVHVVEQVERVGQADHPRPW